MNVILVTKRNGTNISVVLKETLSDAFADLKGQITEAFRVDGWSVGYMCFEVWSYSYMVYHWEWQNFEKLPVEDSTEDSEKRKAANLAQNMKDLDEALLKLVDFGLLE